MLFDHLEKIKHFMGVTRYKSIRKYSIKENISQSAVSKSIQVLEDSLNTKLFIRKQTGVELTQAGLSVLKFSEELKKLIDSTENQIREKTGVKFSGSVKIGSYQSISIYFTPKLVKYIHKSHPELEVNIISDSSVELIKMLKKGEIDLAISVNPKPQAGLRHIFLYKDFYSFFQSPHLEYKKKVYTYLEAQDENKKSVDSHVTKLKKDYQFLSCGDFETAMAMAKEELGLAILPDWVAKQDVDSGRLHRVQIKGFPQSFGPHNIYLSYRKSDEKNNSINWISEQVKLMLGV
jgi:DNA-binding transcriptional LysR family regulator